MGAAVNDWGEWAVKQSNIPLWVSLPLILGALVGFGRDVEFGSQVTYECVYELNQNWRLPGQERRTLCGKFRTDIFIQPYRVVDEGYVLASPSVFATGARTYKVLDEDKIRQMQAAHQLPDPLPLYHMSTLQFIAGHRIWWFPLFLVTAFALALYVKRRNIRRRLAAEG
jgi:hypothetical protein